MICSITIAVKGRAPVFACPAVAAAVDVLRPHAAATGVPVHAWGVMADHVHPVLGASPTCDIVTCVGQFKNLAQRDAWRRGRKGTVWQTSFWDDVLRGDERLEPVVEIPAGDEPPPYSENRVNAWVAASWAGIGRLLRERPSAVYCGTPLSKGQRHPER